MTKIEDELRSLYADPVGAREVEASILDAFTNRLGGTAVSIPESPRPRARRTASSWTAAGVSAAVVTVLAVGVVVAARPTTTTTASAGATSAPAAPNSTTPVASTSPSTAQSPSAEPSNVTVTPQVIAQTLISLLPRKGETTKLSGSYSTGSASAELVYDDGHGRAQVSVLLQLPYDYEGTLRPGSGPLCTSALMPNQHCTTRSDGSQLSTYQGDANIPGGATEWEVSELRADGVLVAVTEWNSPSEKDAPQTRSKPPFTMQELTAITQSPNWQATVTADAAQRATHLFKSERSGP